MLMARALACGALLLALAVLQRGKTLSASRSFLEVVSPRAAPSAEARRPRPLATPAEASFPAGACSPSCAALGSALFAAAAAGLARTGSRRGATARRARAVATRPDQVIPWYDRLPRPRTETGVGVFLEKLNMTTIYNEDGTRTSASILVIKRGGNVVTGKRWPERHGSYKVQVGYQRYVAQEWENKPGSGGRSAKIGRLAAADLPPLQKLQGFFVRPQEWIKYEIGQKLVVSEMFKVGDIVEIHGKSKEKGFASAIKRWNHKQGPMAHGSKHHRRYGSLGGGTGIARVFPGKKMPGWMGGAGVVVKCEILKIMDNIDEDNMPETIVVVKGHVPGYSAHWKEGGSFVYMHHAKDRTDGRFKRDPVWMWYIKDDNSDPYVPIPCQAWTWKSYWGRDMRWLAAEQKKYWPDGFPGYDHSTDPFYDDCDPKKALKAPEW